MIIVGCITDVISPLVFKFLRWSADHSNRELRPNGIWSKVRELHLLHGRNPCLPSPARIAIPITWSINILQQVPTADSVRSVGIQRRCRTILYLCRGRVPYLLSLQYWTPRSELDAHVEMTICVLQTEIMPRFNSMPGKFSTLLQVERAREGF